jgi:SAM-dependent methyltransferase
MPDGQNLTMRASPRPARALLKKIVACIPFGNTLTRSVLSLGFRGSPSYWEARYAKGQNSGVGSYGAMAEFKSDFLRAFVHNSDIRNVIDFGCGDGNQISHLASVSYVGLDISETAIQLCRHKYRDDPTKSFVLYNPNDRFDELSIMRADMAMSLDVIFHLVEDDLFGTYIANLFAAANRFVVIYSSNVDKPTESPHVRHRNVTSHIESNIPDWVLHQRLANPHKGDLTDSDFYVFKYVGARGS